MTRRAYPLLGGPLAGPLGLWVRGAATLSGTYVLSENSGADFTGVQECELIQGEPNNNSSAGNAFEASAFGPGDARSGIVSFFGLPSVPAGPVAGCQVRLWVLLSAQTKTVALRRLLVPNDTFSATWNSRLVATPWSAGGAKADGVDRVAAASATLSIAPSASGYLVFGGSGVDADVAFWRANPSLNYGWLVEVDGTAPGGSITQFAGSNALDGRRPE
ncbi:MAG: hypothetical protein ACRC2H_01360, partial [Silanimonas sp.]